MNGFSLWLYEMRAALRRPAPLFLSLLIPIILLSLAILSIYRLMPEEGEQIRAAIVDLDQTFETKALVNQLSKDKEMKKALTLLSMSSEESERNFREGNLAGIIEIPKGFSESLRRGENEPIQVITNEEQPLESNMLKLLLESGGMYISASQSAVNTVYDLHIQNLTNSKERNQKLQQSILTFTLFALSRNDAFSQELLPSGSRIGWAAHALIALLLTLLGGFAVLFQWLDGRHVPGGMMLRLRSYHITEVQLWRVQCGKWFFFICFAGVLYWGVLIQWRNLLSTESVIITVLACVFMATLVACGNSLISHPSLRTLIILLVMFLGMGSGGVWVPSLFLPAYISTEWNPFAILYLLYEETLLGEPFSNRLLLKILCWIFVLLGMGLFAVLRKERRHAYVSVVKRS